MSLMRVKSFRNTRITLTGSLTSPHNKIREVGVLCCTKQSHTQLAAKENQDPLISQDQDYSWVQTQSPGRRVISEIKPHFISLLAIVSRYRFLARDSMQNSCREAIKADKFKAVLRFLPVIFSLSLAIKDRYGSYFLASLLETNLTILALPYKNTSWETFSVLQAKLPIGSSLESFSPWEHLPVPNQANGSSGLCQKFVTLTDLNSTFHTAHRVKKCETHPINQIDIYPEFVLVQFYPVISLRDKQPLHPLAVDLKPHDQPVSIAKQLPLFPKNWIQTKVSDLDELPLNVEGSQPSTFIVKRVETVFGIERFQTLINPNLWPVFTPGGSNFYTDRFSLQNQTKRRYYYGHVNPSRIFGPVEKAFRKELQRERLQEERFKAKRKRDFLRTKAFRRGALLELYGTPIDEAERLTWGMEEPEIKKKRKVKRRVRKPKTQETQKVKRRVGKPKTQETQKVKWRVGKPKTQETQKVKRQVVRQNRQMAQAVNVMGFLHELLEAKDETLDLNGSSYELLEGKFLDRTMIGILKLISKSKWVDLQPFGLKCSYQGSDQVEQAWGGEDRGPETLPSSLQPSTKPPKALKAIKRALKRKKKPVRRKFVKKYFSGRTMSGYEFPDMGFVEVFGIKIKTCYQNALLNLNDSIPIPKRIQLPPILLTTPKYGVSTQKTCWFKRYQPKEVVKTLSNPAPYPLGVEGLGCEPQGAKPLKRERSMSLITRSRAPYLTRQQNFKIKRFLPDDNDRSKKPDTEKLLKTIHVFVLSFHRNLIPWKVRIEPIKVPFSQRELDRKERKSREKQFEVECDMALKEFHFDVQLDRRIKEFYFKVQPVIISYDRFFRKKGQVTLSDRPIREISYTGFAVLPDPKTGDLNSFKPRLMAHFRREAFYKNPLKDTKEHFFNESLSSEFPRFRFLNQLKKLVEPTTDKYTGLTHRMTPNLYWDGKGQTVNVANTSRLSGAQLEALVFTTTPPGKIKQEPSQLVLNSFGSQTYQTNHSSSKVCAFTERSYKDFTLPTPSEDEVSIDDIRLLEKVSTDRLALLSRKEKRRWKKKLKLMLTTNEDTSKIVGSDLFLLISRAAQRWPKEKDIKKIAKKRWPWACLYTTFVAKRVRKLSGRSHELPKNGQDKLDPLQANQGKQDVFPESIRIRNWKGKNINAGLIVSGFELIKKPRPVVETSFVDRSCVPVLKRHEWDALAIRLRSSLSQKSYGWLKYDLTNELSWAEERWEEKDRSSVPLLERGSTVEEPLLIGLVGVDYGPLFPKQVPSGVGDGFLQNVPINWLTAGQTAFGSSPASTNFHYPLYNTTRSNDLFNQASTFSGTYKVKERKRKKMLLNSEPLSARSALFLDLVLSVLFLGQVSMLVLSTWGEEVVLPVFDFLVFHGIYGPGARESFGLLEDLENNYRVIPPKAVVKSFKDIVGIDRIINQLGELTWFLCNSARPLRHSAKIPKGVLLVGPPGSGKSLLVRTIAGEAQVPVVIPTGKYLVRYKERVVVKRNPLMAVFEKARQKGPCILFIDEFDTLGEGRASVMSVGVEIDSLAVLARQLPSFMFNERGDEQGKERLLQKLASTRFACFAARRLESIQLNRFTTRLGAGRVDPSTARSETTALFDFSTGFNKNLELSLFRAKVARTPFKPQMHKDESSNDKKSPFEKIDLDDPYLKSHIQAKRDARKVILLTSLLTELDGLRSRDKVLVIGATNRPEALDSALIRPGRIDRILKIELPEENKRVEILKFYGKEIEFEKDLSWGYLSKRTLGFSVADLETAMNKSLIQSAFSKKSHTLQSIEQGIDSVIGSYRGKGKIKHTTALRALGFYQAGKATLFQLLTIRFQAQKVWFTDEKGETRFTQPNTALLSSWSRKGAHTGQPLVSHNLPKSIATVLVGRSTLSPEELSARFVVNKIAGNTKRQNFDNLFLSELMSAFGRANRNNIFQPFNPTLCSLLFDRSSRARQPSPVKGVAVPWLEEGEVVSKKERGVGIQLETNHSLDFVPQVLKVYPRFHNTGHKRFKKPPRIYQRFELETYLTALYAGTAAELLALPQVVTIDCIQERLEALPVSSHKQKAKGSGSDHLMLDDRFTEQGESSPKKPKLSLSLSINQTGLFAFKAKPLLLNEKRVQTLVRTSTQNIGSQNLNQGNQDLVEASQSLEVNYNPVPLIPIGLFAGNRKDVAERAGWETLQGSAMQSLNTVVSDMLAVNGQFDSSQDLISAMQNFTLIQKRFYSLQTNIGVKDLSLASSLVFSMTDRWFLSLSPSLPRSTPLNRLVSKVSDMVSDGKERQHHLRKLVSEKSTLIGYRRFNKSYSSQTAFFRSWWQMQACEAASSPQMWQYTSLSFLEGKALLPGNWARIFFPNPEQNRMNVEWRPRDRFHKMALSLKSVLSDSSALTNKSKGAPTQSRRPEVSKKHKLYVNWNDLYKLDRDCIAHGLVLACFDRAFSVLDCNRETLDYLADYLVRFETLRQEDLFDLFGLFGYNLSQTRLAELMTTNET